MIVMKILFIQRGNLHNYKFHYSISLINFKLSNIHYLFLLIKLDYLTFISVKISTDNWYKGDKYKFKTHLHSLASLWLFYHHRDLCPIYVPFILCIPKNNYLLSNTFFAFTTLGQSLCLKTIALTVLILIVNPELKLQRSRS